GVYDGGLFFTGSNGYRLTKLQSVQDVIDKLVGNKVDDDTWDEQGVDELESAVGPLALSTG
ncbi:MAG: hypothetical protein O7G32_12385, partial [SAR324 cluster bacterium]|nr:hypothetical protein [SAR324 cluster bacterium]